MKLILFELILFKRQWTSTVEMNVNESNECCLTKLFDFK